MGSFRKYHSLDHSGLEVADRYDAPEVVPQSSPPLARQSSLLQPEPYHVAPYYKDHQEYGNYYGEPDTAAPTYSSGSNRPSYLTPDSKEGFVNKQEHQEQSKDGRRYCGMRKAIFIAVVTVITILVIVAIVLGVIFGVVLPNKE